MKKMDLVQMENVQGGDAESIICNTTCSVLGTIWGAAAGVASGGLGIFTGILVSVACGEIFC